MSIEISYIYIPKVAIQVKYRIFIIVILILSVLSCNNSDSNSANQNYSTQNQNDIITEKKIEQLKYLDYTLSTEANEVVLQWPMYQELQTQINFLQKADLTFFTSDRKVLDSLMLDLNTQVPEKLQTKPIMSRIDVVKTKLLKLQSNLTIDNVATETKIESIRELLQANSNLNLQINKKLEFDTFNKITPE